MKYATQNMVCIRTLVVGITGLACLISQVHAQSSWSVEPVPSLVIGGDQPEQGHELHRVVAATRLSDGRIVVANASTSELRYYDVAGSLVSVAGRDGDGPGEFRSIWDMIRLPGDTLLILARSPGLTWLGPDGDFVRQIRLDYVGARLPCMLFEAGVAPLPNARLLLRYERHHRTPDCGAVPAGVSREAGLVAIYDPATRILDTLITLPGTERDGRDYRLHGRLLLGVADSHTVYVAETGGESVFMFGLDGRRRGTFSVPTPALPIPEDAKTEPGRQLPFRGESDVSYPTDYPRFSQMMVDGVGLLWLMEYPAVMQPVRSWTFTNPRNFQAVTELARWDVLDREGDVVASVAVPGNIFPFEIGTDYVLGLAKDAFDVESVVVHGLGRTRTR